MEQEDQMIILAFDECEKFEDNGYQLAVPLFAQWIKQQRHLLEPGEE